MSAKIAARYNQKTSNKKDTSSTSKTELSKKGQIGKYEEVESTAAKLQDAVKSAFSKGENLNKLLEEKSNNEQTATEEEKKKSEALIEDVKKQIVSEADKILTYYNSLRDKLEELGGESNLAYSRKLQSVAKENKSALSEIGITVMNDGTLKVDTKLLEGADYQKVKEAFCVQDGFSDKLSEVTVGIEKAATTMIKALDKIYGTQSYNRYAQSSTYYGSQYANSFSSFI